MPGGAQLEALETELERADTQLHELGSYAEKLTSEYNQKVELHECLAKCREFFATEAGLAVRQSNLLGQDVETTSPFYVDPLGGSNDPEDGRQVGGRVGPASQADGGRQSPGGRRVR